MRLLRHSMLFCVAALALCGPARGVLPSEQLTDPALEARARAISQELRCVVCQNQSIDDSDADLAHDLRVILRERLKAGDSDEQAKAYLVQRYGSYVLLRPPFQADTLLLWLGPLLVLGAAGAVAGVYLARRNAGEAAGLSAEEQKRIDDLLNAKDLV